MNGLLATGPPPLADWLGHSDDAWTAFGTLVLAVVTLATLLATILQVRKERRDARAAEQLAEAYAIQVIGSETTALLINHGKYTITGVDGWLRLTNGALLPFTSRTRFLDTQGVDEELAKGIPPSVAGITPASHADILAPWDAGLRFVHPTRTSANIIDSHPVVRWTDRWDRRWEHELGRVSRVQTGRWRRAWRRWRRRTGEAAPAPVVGSPASPHPEPGTPAGTEA